MPRSLNKVMLLGYIADEPNIHAFPNGSKVANATLATNELSRDSETGEMRDAVEWHHLSFWGNLANVAENYVHKGSRLFVEGHLKTRSYTDREGIKRNATDIICDNVILLDSRRDSGAGNYGATGATNYGGNNYSISPEQLNVGVGINGFAPQGSYTPMPQPASNAPAAAPAPMPNGYGYPNMPHTINVAPPASQNLNPLPRFGGNAQPNQQMPKPVGAPQGQPMGNGPAGHGLDSDDIPF